jgi:phenylacetate-CoA ligase
MLPRGIYGRIDDQFTVRGENIQPSAIDEVVSGLRNYGGEHRIVVSRTDAMDTLAVQLEYAPAIADDDVAIKEYRCEAEAALRHKLGVSTTVVPVAPNGLERTEFKARRVIDERDLFRELTGAG